MSFQIATNISSLNAQLNVSSNARNMDTSLSKLSSGLRITQASDDASDLTIADSLRSQSQTLNQSIRNANDGISIITIADKAMEEQVKILDTIKIKATQAAQDGQNSTSRAALQDDITRLMEELDNIATTTTYNGLSLLNGQFTNKSFQIGAESNQTIEISVGNTSSDKIGNTRFETSSTISASSNESLTFSDVDGRNSYTLESVKISTSAGTGIGVLAETINKNSDLLGGIKASFKVVTTAELPVSAGTITSLIINDIEIGEVNDVLVNDKDGKLVSAINDKTSQTGVAASVDSRGHLEFTSVDGRGINITEEIEQADTTDFAGADGNPRFNIQWYSDVDLDPVVVDPSGDSMGYDTSIAGTDSNGDNKTTDSGGIWDVDDTGNGSGDDDPNQENFTWPTTEGAEGDYKVYIKNYGGAVSEDTDVDINFISNGILTTQTVTIPAGSESIGAYSFEHKEPSIINVPTDERENYGRLTLTRVGASDIQVSGSGAATGLTAHMQTNAMEESINLRDIAGALSADQASAMGFNTNVNTIAAVDANNVGAGVTTLQGAMSVMSIADSAREGLDKIRASLGTAQAQFISTINNISVTSVNVQAAESQLRNIDFATESAKFSKQNIIAQAGSYALTQANTKQQAVLQLLQ